MSSANPTKPDLANIIANLSIDEKVSLLSGKDFWTTVPVDRLGVPSLKVSDGPNGARGGTFKGGISSVCFPASVSLASTFDTALVRRIGNALAEETRTKGATVLLGPTVCPHRDPRGGRNFESFSEDPFLAGQLASEYITGLQEKGVGATIKHYAVNEQETKRFTMNANVSQKAMREIYLKPFELAVKKSNPWCLMTSYNLVNGTHADMNKFLIEKVLRGEWGYQGLVMSDWGGTNSTAASLSAGLDLEMPGPGVYRTTEKVEAAIKSGELSSEVLDQRVHKVLELLVKTGKFDDPTIADEQAVDLPEHRKLVREAGADGIVLLKNEQSILPLQAEKLKSVAVVGMAKEFLGHGGGSACVNAHHKITPYQALEEALGNKVELRYSEGARTIRNLHPLNADVVDDDGNNGFSLHIQTTDGSDQPIVKNIANSAYQSLERPNLKSVTLTGTFTPKTTGSHYISLATFGDTKVFIDDTQVFNIEGPSADTMGFLLGVAPEDRKQHQFTSGQSYKIRIEATALFDTTSGLQLLANPIVGFNFGFAVQEVLEADLLKPAVELAQTSDVTIVFTGHTNEWETEGTDRESMDLPVNGSLDDLIQNCAAVNKTTIVVNSTGSPVTMPWVNDVAAIVQAWFPGQEAGYAIADVLLGKVNPSGKLPVTFPKRIEDAPAFGNFPGSVENLQVEYKEESFIGYRHYDRKPETVLFPFGYGLSYTSFEVSDTKVSTQKLSPDSSLEVTATVKNTGSVTGNETVQVYIGPANEENSSVARPKKVLAGFAKVRGLGASQTESMAVQVSVRESCSYWDEERYGWVVPKGKYVVYVATSSAEKDVVSRIDVEVTEEGFFDP